MKLAAKLCLLLLGLSLVSASDMLCPVSDSDMAGGWTDIDVDADDSEDYKDLLKLAEGLIGNLTNVTLPCAEPLVKVVSACSQVVAGTNYHALLNLTCSDSDEVLSLPIHIYVPLEGDDDNDIEVDVLDLDDGDDMDHDDLHDDKDDGAMDDADMDGNMDDKDDSHDDKDGKDDMDGKDDKDDKN